MNSFSLLLAAAFASQTGGMKVEHLGRPCQAKNILAGRVVNDRGADRQWFVLTNMNEVEHMELIFIDPEKDEGRVFRAPAGAGSWALREVAGDRLVVGTYYDGVFMVFDLKQMAFVKTVDFPGESYIWNLAIGSDGRVYGGTYNGAKLGALDLKTYAVEDCGAPAPPNLYLRSVSATPDGRILCSLGMEKPTVKLFDPSDKTFGPLPKTLDGVSAGVSWNGYFLAGSRAFKGKDLEPVDPPPFPAPPADKGAWNVDTYMTTNDVVFIRQGTAIYRYAKGDKATALVADIDLRGGRLLAGDAKGRVLGVRGQDYFVIKCGDSDLALKPIPVESAGRITHFLKADGRGRLWGGPTFGQTLFWMETKTKKLVNTRTISDVGGEVYDATFIKGVVYAAAYCGGEIIRYDPDEPWDQWGHKNPRTIAAVAPGYIRPTGGIVVGADGKLYSGWMAKYGTYGGAIAVTDPATGQTRLMENPLGQQAIGALAVDKGSAYVGTTLHGNGLPEKKGESAKFGVVELATGKVLLDKPMKGVSSVGPIACDKKTGRVAVVVGGALWIFDPVKKAFISSPVEGAPKVTSHVLASRGDGWICYGSEKSLIALNLANGQNMQLGDVPANIANVTLGAEGQIYVSCGADVYGCSAE
ncbi:MAG: hypothetical protein JXQ73_16935 [Phycisphaerae bacterium]|nr:hypothetical protein [Phycisphaerae bacterium]